MKLNIGSLVLLLSLCACSAARDMTVTVRHTRPLAVQASTALMAGAAKIDITPPPGMPMAGFSALSSTARGVRTRLFARVIYLKPRLGKPVALVQCDLLSGSLLVHHRVAELIAPATDVDAEGLLMAGTHTHTGPGNYFASGFYNRFAGNRAGFEPHYFEFLCDRIAAAVKIAFENQRPAMIATGSIRVEGVTQNRSFSAYLKNPHVQDSTGTLTREEAVNPRLHLIRIDCLDRDGAFKPIGAFSTFSLHPNTKPALLGSLYSGDIFAYIEREVEHGIRKRYQTPWEPVHAAANYLHGDNNPKYREDIPENFAELRRIGLIVGQKALELFCSLDDRLLADVPVNFRALEIDMFDHLEKDGQRICGRPVVGAAMLAGARGPDKSSPLVHVPFFAPGWPRWLFTKGCQGHKRVAFGPLQYLYLPKADFPHILFLQVIRIGDVALFPLPFEVTYQMGLRIAAHCKDLGDAAGLQGIQIFIPVSCANGYFGYVTTPEEYTYQGYEGGHTLYGPRTGDYLAAHLGRLTEGLGRPEESPGLPETRRFELKAVNHYPETVQPHGKRAVSQAPAFHLPGKDPEPHWSFRWYDVPPSLIALHERLIRIEESPDGNTWRPLIQDGKAVDDSGWDIAIVHLDTRSSDHMGHYEGRWYNPPPGNGFYRFVILPRDGRPVLYSPAFGAVMPKE